MGADPGDLAMETGLTRNAMTRLTTAGTNLGTGWSAAAAAIDGAVGPLGRGPLGAAFLAGYEGHARQTAEAVTTCCQRIDGLAGVGHGAVTTYETTDADILRAQQAANGVWQL